MVDEEGEIVTRSGKFVNGKPEALEEPDEIPR